MKRICVFCGSNPGRQKLYADVAVELGQSLARRGIGLVYGGASVGLMGTIADAVLANGGEVVGIIPEDLFAKEVGHTGLQELRIVKSMHERKALMAELSDAFIAMPGGFGTFEEICEAVTWSQLGLHQKPCGLLNVAGYYDQFLKFIDHSVSEGFISTEHRTHILDAPNGETLLEKFSAYQPPRQKQWIRQI